MRKTLLTTKVFGQTVARMMEFLFVMLGGLLVIKTFSVFYDNAWNYVLSTNLIPTINSFIARNSELVDMVTSGVLFVSSLFLLFFGRKIIRSFVLKITFQSKKQNKPDLNIPQTNLSLKSKEMEEMRSLFKEVRAVDKPMVRKTARSSLENMPMDSKSSKYLH